MDTQYISGKHSVLRLSLLLGFALLTSNTQASTNSSESLLPPTIAETVQQTPTLPEQKENKALSQSEIIDQANSQSADAHVITRNKDGSVRIPSPMQDVIATLTPRGASIYSDDKAGETFSLTVNGLGRDVTQLTKIKPGKITHDQKIARLFHSNLVEEFTTSSAGLRQDFVVPASPKGKGQLIVELTVEGASPKLDAKGVILTLKSGRELAYHNLLVADAKGITLPAHFKLKDKQTLQIIVDDAGAQYPVRIDPTITDADWFSLGAAMPAPNSTVRALVSDGTGNLYMGGQFTTLAGVANTAYIAKWDGSTWSALGSGMNNIVYALAWDGSNLYAGGSFYIAGGVSASRIAKWDGSAWSALSSDIMNNTVTALAWDGSNLYAGGPFTNAGGITANHIAKWDGSAWSALGTGMNSYGHVRALAWDGSNLYAGGDFTSAGGVANTTYIAKWNGSAWSALGSGMSGNVYALTFDGTNLYAGGLLPSAGGVTVNRIAQWDGSSWSALGSGMNSAVYALAYDGTHLYAGGSFTSAGDAAANLIAQWDGSTWGTLGSGMNGGVYALAFDSSKLYAGGYFTSAGGVSANYIAKWDGSTWSALGSGTDSTVWSLTSDGSNLYAGGAFTSAGGEANTNYIAKWNGSTWSALGTGMNDWVQALLWDGSNLYAGGYFTSADGVVASKIAKWNGSVWSALGSGMDVYVRALAWDGSTLYAGGWFTSAGDKNAGYVAGVTLFDTTPDPLAFSDVTDAALSSVITSNTQSITGITTGVDISITGGEYNLNGTGWTSVSVASAVSDGDSLQLRTTSSASYNTTTDVVITVGDGNTTWSVTTMTDTVPDAFSFVDQSDVALNSLISSNTVVISGLGASSAISITGGEYSINGGAYTATAGFINNGDSITLQTTSANDWFAGVDVVLTIGGINDTFTVTTLDVDSDGDGTMNSIDTNDDNDGYPDASDNCTIVANDQTDTDGDGYGNACDSDFNNDGIVNSLDVGLFKINFFTTGSQQTDLNSDNIVNSLDLGLLKQRFGTAPGPSGLVP